MSREPAPQAVVMGGIDVVRPLARAGVPCGVFAREDDIVRRSRRVVARLPWADPYREPDRAVAILLAHAATLLEPPVLYPPTDGMIVLASRRRDELGRSYRLPLADAELIEDLLDKRRFAALAERAGLPAPRSAWLPAGAGAGGLDLRFPLVVKPLARGTGWQADDPYAKAMRVADGEALRQALDAAARTGTDLLAQELVPGPETRIESYHAYVDGGGSIAGEFTGRKVRTLPPSYGESSALEITAEPDVAALGRDVLERIGLRGVAKVDFKRDDASRLLVLEVNPRFNLWHFPGALAGVNLPALVHADLTGRPRPAVRPVRAGVRWSDPLMDVRSARASGMGLLRWAAWTARCRAISGFAWDDPAPFLAGVVWPPVRKRLRRLVPAGS
ncbi:MAG TPA: ATP-grasp domain-containing protein [Solirubrobacteraceae bacterium]|nr:ATP-grasp domain-containing protein [Solirubrobacteraceae bacterium]